MARRVLTSSLQPAQQLRADDLVFVEPLLDGAARQRLARLIEHQPLVRAVGPRSVQTKNDSTNGLSVSASLRTGSMKGRSSGSVCACWMRSSTLMCGRFRYSSIARVSESAVSLLNCRSTTADVVSRSFSDWNWK